MIVLSYRKRGYTFVQIAQNLGCAPSTAHRFVVEVLDAMATTEVEAQRRLECERLDDMMVKSFEGALTGDMRSADAVIKIMGRRAKLLGREIRISQLVVKT